MKLTKKESVKVAIKKCKNMKEFNKIFSETHTCYDGKKGGCGKCHACILRDIGFKQAKVLIPSIFIINLFLSLGSQFLNIISFGSNNSPAAI